MDKINLLAAMLFVGLNLSCSDSSSFSGSKTPSKKADVQQAAEKPASADQIKEPNPPGNSASPDLTPQNDGAQITPDNLFLSISCEEEGKNTSISYLEEQIIELSLDANCSSVKTEFGTQINRTMDLVILLDVTESMEDSINAVKENLTTFAARMEEKGWFAQFAMVAYRDEIVQETNFKSAAEISQDVAAQLAIGGDELQEAGQLALQRGLEMLRLQKRPDSTPALLIISDAPSWATNRDDLSIALFDAEIRKAMEEPMFQELQFYSSVSDEFDPGSSFLDAFAEALEIDIPKAPNISGLKQITDLRASTGVKGTDLPFPFTADTMLDNLILSIQEISKNVNVSCDFISLKREGIQLTTEVAETGKLKVLIPVDSINQTKSISLTITRNCGEGEASVAHQINLTSATSNIPGE